MRTCILKTHSAENEDLFRLTLPNHAEYADRHGYDIVSLHRTYREIWWDIENYILGLIRTYDQLLTVGSDVIFTDIDRPLESFNDGEHSVFIQEEGMDSALVNFDVVLWTKREGVNIAIDWLRRHRPFYANHSWGLQQGMCLMTQDPAMAHVLKVLPTHTLQGFPYPNTEACWRKGDFALHFVGMSNKDKFAGCKQYLENGSVRMGWRVGQNDGF